MHQTTSAADATRREEVLSKAALRAAERLELSQKDLAGILGVSTSSVSRLYGRSRLLSPEDNEGKRALLFLRVYRSLDSLLGGEREKMCAWFKSENQHLAGIPVELMKDLPGLVHVADYLDAMRGTY